MDVLRTFAELGIALAGFSGVVVALGRRSVAEWMLLDGLPTHIPLELSGLVVAFALLPSVLGHSGSWRFHPCVRFAMPPDAVDS